MKVTQKTRNDKALEKRDYRNSMEILVNNKICFNVYDGEPEDSNLSRDFNDCFRITELMRLAYEAGKLGEEFTVEKLEVGLEDEE